MNSLVKPNGLLSGFRAGLFCAFVGAALFTLIQMIEFTIGKEQFNLFVFFPLYSLNFLLTFFPAGLGGKILELLIKFLYRRDL